MEGSAPHSASHSRAAPPPPSPASAAAAFFKKVYTNGAADGGNAFIAYGVTPFAPRAEHYSEIFESFLSGRACSIPMLDLPPFDDSAAFDFVGCSGFVYSEIFGGFDFGDFALSHDQLFRRSDGSQESSESDAWTQAGTEYGSKESDPSACSGRNQYVLNGDFHQTTDNKFNVSYHKVNMLSTEDLNVIHVVQLSAIPGNSDMSEGSSLQKEVEERYSSGVADDIISLEVSSGISAETQSKTASIPSHGSINENGRPHGINLNPTVMSVSDACLTTEPSHAPQASRPPAAAVDRKKDPFSSISTYEHPKSNAVKALFDVSSLDFLNVEFDTGSSGIASAEAIKEAMDTAKVKLKSVRESMEGTKDAAKGTRPVTKNDMNGTERVRTVFDESISRDDELQPKNECEYNLFKLSCIGMQDVSEASQVLPDPFQAAKSTANRAAKPPERKIIKNQPTSVVAEWEDNGSRLKDANHLEDKENACTQKRIGGRKRMVCPRDEKQHSDMWLKKADEESRKREDEMCEKEESETKPNEVQIINQCQKNVEEVTMSDCNEKKLIQSVEKEKFEKLEVATTNNRTEKKVDSAHDLTAKSLKLERSANTDKIDDEVAEEEIENFQMYEDFAINEEQKMDRRDLHAELKSIQQHSYKQRLLTEKNNKVPEMTRKCEDLKSCSLRARLDEKNIKPTAMTSECDEMVKNHECDEMLKNHAAEVMLVFEEKSDLRFGTLFGEMESKMAEMAHIYMSTKHLQKTVTQPVMKERKSNHQKQSLSSNINQRVGQEVKVINGNLDPEDIQNAGKFRRKEEFEREHLRELELEREKERERDLEKEQIRKLEEEREQERETKMKLHLKRLEELRERERKKELNKDCLKKPEEERQGEREIKLEKERLGELDEELEREREREKDRMGVELKTSASHERACAEANEMAERTAVERETAEARQRAMAEARERLEKACAEAREKSLSEKASTEARLRAERFSVARAAAEARERAIEKAMAERDTFEARDQVARSASEKFSSPLRDLGFRHTSSSSDLWNSDKTDEAEWESAQRCRARLERHRRTVERVAKALAEKSTRDLIAQKEQAERNRLAESLDADIKRWSNGKEGNLHALLSTLQYILGPDSGWNSIPLTEILASAAVKKAYRKATLCVHPDKLQQRGATIQQKYICEKVFDLLKDSWNKFNSEER